LYGPYELHSVWRAEYCEGDDEPGYARDRSSLIQR